ncbi:endonuclease Q family protein [Caldibacillus debilis]|uniref:endonuclease Q family protein n=1 Tax=Caldibacillus debilis TaxID=301148 RepID=UPI000B5802D5|nr:endonuclease Q family protein [Caldibacillus debilis]OUM84365.1 MAG: hypothetical protein BAA03_03055 [Caldibacillus debilis]
MERKFADLHIHIGRTKTGRPVKITGAKTLTLTNILHTAKNRKGIDIVGVIDCHSPEVIAEIGALMERGQLIERGEGGLLFEEKILLIPGSEVEVHDRFSRGPIHALCYFPTLERMKQFSEWLSGQVKNIHLSSQKIRATGRQLQRTVKELDGLFIPAHVFTPFKSLFGKGVEKNLAEVFDPDAVDAVELGLSSDTAMADGLKQLHRYPFLSNSDAHSLGKIAREYQALAVASLSFSETVKAIKGQGGRRILANYGLNPLLGKYYRTVCASCLQPPAPSGRCPRCGSDKIITGVSDRIRELSDAGERPARPPYIHQVPLEFLPGIGAKTLEKLLERFHTEMAVLHDAREEELLEVLPERTVSFILKARRGELPIAAGGGGRYGKVAGG